MGELTKLFNIKQISELALSYSRVSDFDRNGSKALDKAPRDALEGEGVRIGSIVNDLLLNKHKFKKLYHLYNGTKPTATLGKLCDIILKNYKKPPAISTILRITRKNSFWAKWSKNKILEAFDIPDFWNYLRAYYIARRKVLITNKDLELSEELVNILLTHSHSRDIFNNDLEHYNEFKFNMEYKGFVLRGIIDKILIDHKNKTIRLIDLKTGKGSILEFTGSFMKWRYYLQEAVYTQAINKICQMLEIEGYELLPFQFLYISRYEKIPLLFTISSKWHNAALLGFRTTSGYRYRGLNELLDEMRWHVENGVFNTSKVIYESGGSLLLDDSFIILDK